MPKFKKGNTKGFKKGYEPYNKDKQCDTVQANSTSQCKYVRVDTKLESLILNTPSCGLQPQPAVNDVQWKFLRSSCRDKKTASFSPESDDYQRVNSDGYRVIHVDKNSQMWNLVFKEHREVSPYCDGYLHWDMKSEQRRGLGCREVAKCNKCLYRSKHFNLYTEVPSASRGRRDTDINLGLQVGLSLSPLGTTSFRRLCFSANIPAPSERGMQKAANKINDKIIEVNRRDMIRRSKRLVQINRLRGLKEPESVHVQCDGMYNNAMYTGIGRTPFQPATQTVYTVAENETKSHDIISVVTKNKLCSTKCRKFSSQSHACLSSSCSANIPYEQSIGDEYLWAKESFQNLQEEGLRVSHVTTDPDSSAYKAAQDTALINNAQGHVHNYIDTRHFAANHRKSMKREGNLLKIVTGKTQKERTGMANRLALDIADRCQAEVSQAYKLFAGDIEKTIRKLSHTCDALVQCYQGDHELCKKNSLVCTGRALCNWLSKSTFLPKTFELQKSEQTEEILRKCFAYRLSPSALKQTSLNANTQKVEGFNRCLRRSLPRNVTFSRNFPGRAHAAAYSVNNGEGQAILNLCEEVGCKIPKGSVVYHKLKKVQSDKEKRKCKQQSISNKISRSMKRRNLFALYEKQQEKKSYDKNMLLKPSLRQADTPKKVKFDHNYSKTSNPGPFRK